MKERKLPERMCVACRTMFPKQSLLRIVKSGEEIKLDFTGKLAGRGAYICDNLECIKKCIKQKTLNRVFGQDIPDEIYRYIEEDYAKRSKD